MHDVRSLPARGVVMVETRPVASRYACPDLDRRIACLRNEPLRDGAAWVARLFRCLSLAAVLLADRAYTRLHDARAGPVGREGAGATRGTWGTRGAGRRHAGLSSDKRDPRWNDGHAGCRRTRPGRRK